MKILIAEDEPVSRRLLEATLIRWGHEVVVTCNGMDAWRTLQGEDAPALSILDWMMPGMDGIDICKKIRQRSGLNPAYIILLTAKGCREDTIAGLEAGANDYVTKPFHPEELRARVQVGIRVVTLERSLSARLRELEEALSRVKQLQGLLPICSYCKRIRNDENYWLGVEKYISDHSGAQFSHGICPGCFDQFVKPQLEKLKEERM